MSAPGTTPGPWAVSKQASRRVTTTHGVVICNAVLRNAGSFKTGIRHGAKAGVEAEANAHLIAASPALYEALEIAMEYVNWLPPEGREAFKACATALAQARGETA